MQLIGDDARGWAWTKALLALPASEIHLCGDGSAVELVRRMAAEMGEAFETQEYSRFTPVQVMFTQQMPKLLLVLRLQGFLLNKPG